MTFSVSNMRMKVWAIPVEIWIDGLRESKYFKSWYLDNLTSLKTPLLLWVPSLSFSFKIRFSLYRNCLSHTLTHSIPSHLLCRKYLQISLVSVEANKCRIKGGMFVLVLCSAFGLSKLNRTVTGWSGPLKEVGLHAANPMPQHGSFKDQVFKGAADKQGNRAQVLIRELSPE